MLNKGNMVVDFVSEIIGGVSAAMLNNPLIGWGGPIISLLLGVATVIALTDIILHFGQPAWAEKGLRFIFFFTLILMNFGVINPRGVFDFQLGEYDYTKKATQSASMSSTAAANTMGIVLTKPTPTLDRDIYNAIAKTFQEFADEISGNLIVKIKDGGTERETSIQEQAMESTLFFLTKVRQARFMCNNSGKDGSYVACLRKYVPYEASLGKEALCKNNGAVGPCASDGDTSQKQDGEPASGNPTKKNFLLSLVSSTGDALLQGVTLIMNTITLLYFYIGDFVFSLLLPIFIWILDFIRNLVTLYFILKQGIQAALTLVFAKMMSPLILIPSKMKEVKDAYILVFSTAVFGFVTKIFVIAATLLSLGLHSATYSVMAPRLYNAGEGAVAGALLTGQITQMTFLVYFGVAIVLIIQILAMTKINDACKALTSFSVTQFVSLGEGLVGSAFNIAIALSAMATAGPLIAGKMLAAKAGGLAAAGAGKLAASKVGGALANTKLAKFGTKMASSAARKGMDFAGKAADYGFGKDTGESVRQLLGSQGVKRTPVSISAAPNSGTGGAGKIGGSSGGKLPSDPKETKGRGYSEMFDDDFDSSGSESGSSGKGRSKNRNKRGGSSYSSAGKMESALARFNNNEDDENAPSGRQRRRTQKEESRPGFLKKGGFISSALSVGKIANGLGAMAEGRSFKSGVDSSIATKVENIGSKFKNAINEKVEDLYSDDGVREKIANFNRSIDRVGSDEKMESAMSLQSSVQSLTSRGSLDGKSRDASVLADYEKFEELSSQQKLSKDDMAELSRINNMYSLGASQQKTFQNVVNTNKDFSEFIKEQKNKEAKLISGYTANPTAQNAHNLNSAISSGAISQAALANKNFSNVLNKQRGGYASDMTRELNSIDVEKLSDSKYRQNEDVRRIMGQAHSLASNNSNVSNMVGNSALVNKMTSMGMIDQEYGDSMANMDSRKEIEETLRNVSQTISQFTTGVKTKDGKTLRLTPGGVKMFAGANGGTLDVNTRSINISDLPQDVADKLTKQKHAFTYAQNNPEIAEGFSREFESLSNIFNFVKV